MRRASGGVQAALWPRGATRINHGCINDFLMTSESGDRTGSDESFRCSAHSEDGGVQRVQKPEAYRLTIESCFLKHLPHRLTLAIRGV